MASSAQINAKIIQLINDVELAHQIIHGGPNTVVPTDGGSVRSLANVIGQLDADVNAAADSVLAQVLTARDTAVSSATAASGSATGAQASRVAAVSSASAASASALAAAASATAAQTSQTGAAASLTAVQTLATNAAGSATTASNAATTATSAAGTATTANTEAQAARTTAVNAAGAASGSATAAANSATAASGSATAANNSATAAAGSATAASGSATAASGSAGAAATSATNAAASATAAQISASVAVNAPGTSATSTTAITLGTGAKALTLAQADKAFLVGQWVSVVDTAAPNTRWLHGVVTAFTPGTGAMTVNVTRSGGSGTFSAWLVMPASPTYDNFLVNPDGSISMPQGATFGGPINLSAAAPTIGLIDTDASMADFYLRANDNHFYLLADRDSNGATEAPIPLDVDLATSTAYLFGSRVWTAANDGATSGLDADLVRGLGLSAAGARWSTIPFVANDGTMEVGKYLDFHGTAGDAADYGSRLYLPETNGRASFLINGAVGGYAGLGFTSAFGARQFLLSTTNADSGIHNGTSWDWKYDAAAGNLLVGSNGVWHAANLPFQVAGGNVGLGAAPGTGKLEMTVADAAMAMRMIAGTGRLRYRPYVDANIGALIESVNTAESGYLPLSLYGSSLRMMPNGGSGLIVNTAGAAFGTAPIASVPLMVHTGSNRNVGMFDQGSSATVAGITDSGASAMLRLIGNVLIFGGDGSAEHMRLNPNGNLSLGYAGDAGQRLYVNGDGRFVGSLYQQNSVDGASAIHMMDAAGNTRGALYATPSQVILRSYGALPVRVIVNNIEALTAAANGLCSFNVKGSTTPTPDAGTADDQIATTLFVERRASAAVPAGAVMYFPNTSPPAGYLAANGAAVSRTTYAALYAALGGASSVWGQGDGATTFNVPDLRGEFVRGWDNGRGLDSGRAFGSIQSSQNLAHTHYLFEGVGGIYGYASASFPNQSIANAMNDGGASSYALGGPNTSTGQPRANMGLSSTAGGGESRPRNVALLACIKY